MAARILLASPLALAASTAFTASSTALSCTLMAAAACSRSADLRLNASSMGLRKASHSFCSCLRSIGTACASCCQRCCRLFTASMRIMGAAPSTLASSIMAARRARLAVCAASSGPWASLIAALYSGCSSAKVFSPTWPPLRHCSLKWCSSRLTSFQSVRAALAAPQALMSSIITKRWALCAPSSALTFSSQASTNL